MSGEGRPGTLVDSVEGNRRRLGKAVHPAALMRLHELWPQAIVKVRHGVNAFGNRRTTVYIIPEPHRYPEYGSVSCDSGDQYVRAYGVREAFRRALVNATKRWQLREAGYENPKRTATEYYV